MMIRVCRLFPYKLLLIAAALAIAGGCQRSSTSGAPHSRLSRAARPQPAKPAIDLDKVRPNEVGRVLILEYHDVSDKEGRWSRHYNNFKADLQRLYRAGYRPISLRDFVQNNVDTPAGTSPVVLTFDDGTAGQFRYVQGPHGPEIDPDCAVGILQSFHAEKPDWKLEATFYVYYPNPFRQPRHIEQKLRQIISLGMDIGNHTYSHVNLKDLSASEAAREMALAVKAAQDYAPEATVDSIALPYGLGPRDQTLLRSGEYEGRRYENLAALLVGAEPAPSPAEAGFDPYRLPRVQAIQTELDTWLGYFERHPDRRYVSDGDPETITVPRQAADKLSKDIREGKRVRVY